MDTFFSYKFVSFNVLYLSAASTLLLMTCVYDSSSLTLAVRLVN